MHLRGVIGLGFVAFIGAVQMPVPAYGAEEPAAPGLCQENCLFGDWGGLRGQFAKAGITFGLQDINEVWGNATGGRRRAATYNGQTLLNIGLDTDTAFGWKGGIFNVSALQIRGRSLASDATLALQTNSGANASRSTRLWEAWYQQSFPGDTVDLKLGMQSLDLEFMTSEGAGLFLNTMMGWPMLPSANLYAGGPAYPLSSLGGRLRVRANEQITMLGGVFQDNPPGGPFADDGPLRGTTRWGGNFNLRTGALAIAEAQYAFNQPAVGTDGKPLPPTGLPGTYKLGAWYDSAGFPSQRYDNAGIPLASPASKADPRMLRANWSLYGVADQGIWRPSAESPQLLSVFLRAMGGPGDRNLIGFSLNAGLTLKAPLPDRDDDIVGIGIGIARLSAGAIGFDRDFNRYNGTAPIRAAETFLELTYQIAVVQGWKIQPDFQYVFLPGGGVANPNGTGRRVANEAIFGLRSLIAF